MYPESARSPALGLAAGLAAVLALGCSGGGSEVPTEAPAEADAFTQRLERFARRPANPPRLAFLAGVDRYARSTSPSFGDLEGCSNDVERMRSVLVERFGFASEDVFAVLDEEATHANLVRSLQHAVIERAGPRTQAFVFLAMHGSQVPDASGSLADEPDGFDSSYIAHDSRAAGHDGERDLSDDQLRSLARALCAKGADLTLVTDTCHSGGGLRGGAEWRVRKAPPGTRALDREWLAGFWPAGIELRDDGPGAAPTGRFRHIAACRRHELAHELVADDREGEPRTYGALTLYLTESLARATPQTSWRSVIDRASVSLRTRGVPQTIHAEGDLDRALFDGEFRVPVGFAARALDDERILVQAGTIASLGVGSVLTIRPFDEEADAPLGLARVEKARLSSAIARWTRRPEPAPEAGTILRALEHTRPAGVPALAVLVEDEALRGQLAESPWIDLRARAEADYVVRRDAGEVRLDTLEGLHIRSGPPAILEALLRREARHRAVDAFGNVQGGFEIELEFLPPARAAERGYTPVELIEDDPFAPTVRGARSDAPPEDWRVGMFRMTNRSDRTLHVKLLSVTEQRDINAIDPANTFSSPLEAGASRDVAVSFVIRDGWPFERAMRDRYLMFATTTEADYGEILQESTLRGDAPPLPAWFSAAIAPPRTRGAGGSPNDAAEFAVRCIDVWVVPPR